MQLHPMNWRTSSRPKRTRPICDCCARTVSISSARNMYPTAELKLWPRRGGRGVFINHEASRFSNDCYVCEIALGQKLDPIHHLYEEMVLVLSGRGSTIVWNNSGAYKFRARRGQPAADRDERARRRRRPYPLQHGARHHCEPHLAIPGRHPRSSQALYRAFGAVPSSRPIEIGTGTALPEAMPRPHVRAPVATGRRRLALTGKRRRISPSPHTHRTNLRRCSYRRLLSTIWTYHLPRLHPRSCVATAP